MTLRGEDAAWVRSVYPRAETDDVWRRLFDDYNEQAATLERVRASLNLRKPFAGIVAACRAALGPTPARAEERRSVGSHSLDVALGLAPAQAEPRRTVRCYVGGGEYQVEPAQADEPDPCSCDEALALRARLVTLEAELAELTNKQYRAVALLIDANLRGDRLEKRAKLWHRLARMKHRALHMTEPVRFDSQLERPVRGG